MLLIGPSGSGKSTLLRTLAGLVDSVDAGELTGSVTLGGQPAGSRPGDVGLVLQEPGAGVVASTVGRDVAFGLENIGMPRSQMLPRITAALTSVGLDDLALDRPTSRLSGGQTQRLAIAGALALQPRVLLLDEPTAMLDADNAASVREAVVAVMASGVTTVVVEHLLGPWVPLIDRVLVLSTQGVLIADGPVEEVLATRHTELVDLGLWVPGAPDPRPTPPPPAALVPPRPGRRVSATALTVGERAHTTAAIDAIPGSLTALVGESGSGKSTILHALAGFLPVSAGETSIPTDLPARELARSLAWVPQWSSSTIVEQSVLAEVLVTSRALGEADEGATVRARALLAGLGLGHLEAADPRQLSGGEQRRLAVAAALHHAPPTLLVDEPTIGQDRDTWAALVGLVAAYRSLGGAVVAATHDAAVIERAEQVLALIPPERSGGASSPRGWVDRCGPLALLLGAFLGVPAGVLSPNWRVTLGVLALQVVLIVLGLGRRVPGALLRALPGVLAAVLVGWSTWWLARDLDSAGTAALRVLAIVLPSAALLPVIDPDALGDHLAQRLNLPDRPVVAVSAALARVHAFGEVWRELARARRVRGLEASWRRPLALGRHLWALTLGLLVRTLRYAADLAIAMDARGFAKAFRRTWWGRAPWRWADTLLVVAAALPAAYAVWSRQR